MFLRLIALSFGVIVIGGAFVVKYVGTMVLQVGLCFFVIISIFSAAAD